MIDKIFKGGLTRRQFIKTTAVTAALVGIGDKLFGGPVSSLVKSVQAAPVKEDKWLPSACWMCREGCGILAHRVDGVIVKVEGNPESVVGKGRLCGKGVSGLMSHYDPNRLTVPLRRRAGSERAKTQRVPTCDFA